MPKLRRDAGVAGVSARRSGLGTTVSRTVCTYSHCSRCLCFPGSDSGQLEKDIGHMSLRFWGNPLFIWCSALDWRCDYSLKSGRNIIISLRRDTKMDASKVDTYIMGNQKYLPAEKIIYVKTNY